MMLSRFLFASALLVLAGQSPVPATPDHVGYRIAEGRNLNAFERDGPVAAHLVLRSGRDPRLLVAFPAGNSGAGIWFKRLDRAATWRIEQAPQPVTLVEPSGGQLNGIRSVVTIDAPRLDVRQAVLSNIRFLRDYEAIGKFPSEVATEPTINGQHLSYARRRLDGAPGYRLDLDVLSGTIQDGAIVADGDRSIRLRVTAATGDKPLTGFAPDALLNASAANDPAARHTLEFLAYHQKFLAGSWRFDTYFGRDTLMSVRLLMPALKPAPVEAGLSSVLARLSPDGQVAHEEGISEFAIVENRKHGAGDGTRATLDYGMVDDDYMLGPVAAHYLLGSGRTRAAEYLSSRVDSIADPGQAKPAGRLLVRNLRFVVDQARAFARDPRAMNLISLKPGHDAGQWRDSNDGIGGGRYPYDVNATLVPAALQSTAELLKSGLLDPYTTSADRAALAEAAIDAKTWISDAAPLFAVDVPNGRARRAISTYAAQLKVPSASALTALGKQPVRFHAISLDASGHPVPIINSDEGFRLLFLDPTSAELDTIVTSVMRPFPAGLMTDVGLLIANPVLASPTLQAKFTPGAYHGTVVWSWQQALLAAGLERQLTRGDLPPATRTVLRRAQVSLWRAITATKSVQSSELWSWAYDDGHYRVVPFGAARQDVDESNAAQLWSTVYLAVTPPRR